jgi:hypothetical protein
LLSPKYGSGATDAGNTNENKTEYKQLSCFLPGVIPSSVNKYTLLFKTAVLRGHLNTFILKNRLDLPQLKLLMRYTTLLFFVFATLLFCSCKKQRACLCVSTFTKTGYNSYTVSSEEKIDKKTTKKTGEKLCSHVESQMQKNHSDYITGNEKVSVSCALK